MLQETFDLSVILKQKSDLTFREKIIYVCSLSIPGILAQVSSIVMQYIDAAMAGSLGENASAAIGLVASATWILGSLYSSFCLGFSVLVSQAVGKGNSRLAKCILRGSILWGIVFSVALTIPAALMSFKIPLWLGGKSVIQKDAAMYFLVFALSTPFFLFVCLFSGILQAAGEMKVPSVLNILMCFLDVFFNYVFIFILKYGVLGAALGSAVSAFSVFLIMSWYVFFKFGYFKKCGKVRRKDFPSSVKSAVKIAVPVAVEKCAFTSALVAVTKMIAPLGETALAANSFAVTAESLCYMPAYGIQEASTTLTGQSFGAQRKDLARSFSFITVFFGAAIMALTGSIMFFICPFVFKFLTPVESIQNLSVEILRLELFAEPFFGASIVASGALRGTGDVFVPGILNLISLWIVRITLSFLLAPVMGLKGIWLAMAVELCFRGIILTMRLWFKYRNGGL